MSEGERVDIKKFILGFIKPVEWFKAASTGLKISIFLVAIFLVWNTFFNKKQVQTTIFKGKVGKVDIIQNRQKSLIPFVEGGVEKNNNTKFETFIRAGLRFEW